MKSSTATATTATAESRPYVGRFAPSPTGDLHLGSLLTAVSSFLDARANHGRWLLRMEDLDSEREVPGAASRILRCLEAFGLHWDGAVVYQSERTALYGKALGALARDGRVYRCACSRAQLSAYVIYPGTCRRTPAPAAQPAAIRFAVKSTQVEFCDRVQGQVRADPSASTGDFIIQRRDGQSAYMLAAVVDDAAQGITHVVRGADLLEMTAAQIQLQEALRLPRPAYAHVPVLTESDGGKLAKARRSVALDATRAADLLCTVFALLGLRPPDELRGAMPADCWIWAIAGWDIEIVTRQRSLPAPG